ncbi:DUF2947 domain-containing protein [Motilimonas pumila]|uniref:DUF2947 family protein n=1 Tax=Motilimonas pumila TaxID=2303987 RepID=A0A418YFP2_9GAMM|nr:DUF2947 domain-containing protein [Motilimonas pumila]RJG48195.1 DUF2947 family protein [Motilimonas pumila]
MNYFPLDEHKKAWVFKRHDLPISEPDLATIKPMVTGRAGQLWQTRISKQSDHPDFFKKGDWPFNVNSWHSQGNWETQWDSDNAELPDEILTSIDWPDHTTVYFCCDKRNVIETQWGTFKRCWKNFLFMDDGSLLIAKKQLQALQFLSNGDYRLGSIS